MAQANQNSKSRFVLLPSTNMWNVDMPGTAATFMKAASRRLHKAPGTKAILKAGDVPPLTVIDEVAPHESMLVELSESAFVDLMRAQPGLRVVPVVECRPLWLRRIDLTPIVSVTKIGIKTPFPISVVADDTGLPIVGADVYAFSDRASQTGSMGLTNAQGVAPMMLPGTLQVLDVVEVLAPDGYWPAYLRQVNVTPLGVELRCAPIDLKALDVRDHFGLRGTATDGAGVVVAVIDTGATAHKDLVITKGMNVVKGEDADKYPDQLGHGTHVCGIIAGRGTAGSGTCGVAPGVTLHVYKVFGKNKETADSFHIAKAIRQAVDDGCDLINLSLGADTDMPDVFREIQRARALGVVCLAATGNDYRKPVGYPARYSQVIAVSAGGRIGTYPAGASQEMSAVDPFGKVKDDFVADFSNIGSNVSLIGPGVGIVSTHRRKYAVMDGTSMACPVATGALARMLGKNSKILKMDRDQKRSDAIIKLALTGAKTLGFRPVFEGSGILV